MTKTKDTISVYPLYEGTFSVGLDKKFCRIDRNDSPAKGALKISLNPFLIKTSQRNYLFDTGIGSFGENTGTETIKQNLLTHNLAASDITDIFATHLHYDHIGGLAGNNSGDWELTFPEADIWVSKNGWQKALSLDPYYDEEKTEFLHFLDANADLHFLSAEDQPYHEIKVREIGGHTEFSQLLLFEKNEHKYMMAGDVLATRSEVNRKFAAKYDYNDQQSMKIRKELTEKAYNKKFTIMGYHETHHPLFKLIDYDEQQGYSIKNMEANAPA